MGRRPRVKVRDHARRKRKGGLCRPAKGLNRGLDPPYAALGTAAVAVGWVNQTPSIRWVDVRESEFQFTHNVNGRVVCADPPMDCVADLTHPTLPFQDCRVPSIGVDPCLSVAPLSGSRCRVGQTNPIHQWVDVRESKFGITHNANGRMVCIDPPKDCVADLTHPTLPFRQRMSFRESRGTVQENKHISSPWFVVSKRGLESVASLAHNRRFGTDFLDEAPCASF